MSVNTVFITNAGYGISSCWSREQEKKDIFASLAVIFFHAERQNEELFSVVVCMMQPFVTLYYHLSHVCTTHFMVFMCMSRWEAELLFT